jgi:hypothetical protein
LSFEFDQDLYQWSMAFACCQMEWREVVLVCAVYNFEEFVILVELLFGVT